MIWPFRRRARRRRDHWWTVFPRLWRWTVWITRLLLLLFIVDLFYLGSQWPDWEGLSKNAIPQSNFIRAYKKQRQLDKTLPPLRWQPVSFSDIPKFVGRMVIVAEDSRFYWHDGFDLLAFKDAMDYNLSEGKMAFGASTISQQTVKNLFLSGSRSPLRKWHELLLTWSMERNLKKDRILELYLNIAEFGQGIYGVEAASLYYWDKPVSELSRVQAAELAASLPS
ncbi:MAG: transglycosylase domain-containing protein, partial [Gammaproteobacteria bacterium]|nr:transglycosylase domain-containing protein [Gammaproteobacteria bacterium]